MKRTAAIATILAFTSTLGLTKSLIRKEGSGSYGFALNTDQRPLLTQEISDTGTIMHEEINLQAEDNEVHILDFDWDWEFNAGYTGRYNSRAIPDTQYWQFDYTLRAFSDLQTTLTTTLLSFYKFTLHFQFDFLDMDVVKQYLRFVRPKVLMTDSTVKFNINVMTDCQVRSLL